MLCSVNVGLSSLAMDPLSFQPLSVPERGPAGTPVTLNAEQLSLFQESTPLHAYITQVLGVSLAIDRERSQLLLRGRPDDVNKAINAVHQAAPSQLSSTAASAAATAKPVPPPHPLSIQSSMFTAPAHQQPQPQYPPQHPAPAYYGYAADQHDYGGQMIREAGPRYDDGAEDRENQVVFQMYEKDTARLIGRRGAHLHQLQDETGARIQVDSNVPPGAPRTVYVWGSVNSVDNALIKIYNKIRRTGEPFLPIPKPSFADHVSRQREPHPLEVEHEWPVEIPISKKPFLSAEVVKEIEQNSGATVSFYEDGDETILRLIVKGQPLPIHYAVAALIDQVDGDLKEPTQIEDDSPDYAHLDAWLKEPLPQNS
jgi:hypothetical protein